jgi:hypothetical protein
MEGIHNAEGKKPVEYPQIAEEILQRVAVDQDMREQSLDDDSVWDESVDAENTSAMKRIVEEIGWPTVSRVGTEAAHAAWLLVQHADHDPEFQEYCLEQMKSESGNGVDAVDIAYLEDRVRVNTNRPQIYGTQFHETRDEETRQVVVAYGPQPIENREQLDERRATVGLEPFEEYRRNITARYYPHLLDQSGE